MRNASSQSISQSFARMFARDKQRLKEDVAPDCECLNCKSTFWEPLMDMEWYCFICGNRGHWEGDVFVQSTKRKRGKKK